MRDDEGGRDEAGTLSEKSAGACHRAVSLHRGCVLVCFISRPLPKAGRELQTVSNTRIMREEEDDP